MVNSHSQAAFQFSLNKLDWNRLLALFVWVLLLVGAANAVSAQSAGEQVTVVNGTYDGTAFGVGSSLRITGRVTKGAMSFGGDVIVEGVVEGDVATIGGSVIQKPGSRIGGDVIVVGGTYRADDSTAQRRPEAMTIMYAGYQQELRDMMRNPTGLFSPSWTPTYFGTRLLVVLFWFLVSLGFTYALPGTISRGIARLQLTSLRVAAIGLTSAVVLYGFVILCLLIMPQPVRVLVGLLAVMFSLVAALFGRVVLYAATGRWIQSKYAFVGKNSEAVALLIGTSVWVLLTSLPYVWPFMATFILIISFGLALTARYRLGWSH
jgi:hypothetical protein